MYLFIVYRYGIEIQHTNNSIINISTFISKKPTIAVKWVSDPIIWRKMILIRIMIRGYDLRCSGYKSVRALDCTLGIHKLEINSGSSKLGSRAVEQCDPVSSLLSDLELVFHIIKILFIRDLSFK